MTTILALLLAFFAGGALATWIWVLLAHLRTPQADPYDLEDHNVRSIRPRR